MFIVSQQRKKYTPEYRREAANLVIESERPIAAFFAAKQREQKSSN